MKPRREVWRDAHGPIPKGYVVHSLNGDSGDIHVDNLAAIPRNTDNIDLIIGPYRVRIRNLEKLLKQYKEKE